MRSARVVSRVMSSRLSLAAARPGGRCPSGSPLTDVTACGTYRVQMKIPAAPQIALNTIATAAASSGDRRAAASGPGVEEEDEYWSAGFWTRGWRRRVIVTGARARG